jgi:hypothetical protein
LVTAVKGVVTLASLTSLTLALGTGFFYSSTFPVFVFEFAESSDILAALGLFCDLIPFLSYSEFLEVASGTFIPGDLTVKVFLPGFEVLFTLTALGDFTEALLFTACSFYLSAV